jgi:hypothetical protein
MTETPIRRQRSRFWWVWTKTGGVPDVFHNTIDGAFDEARTLAAEHPDKKFIVMQALGKFSVRPEPIAVEAVRELEDA